jgi:hypothetical protein
MCGCHNATSVHGMSSTVLRGGNVNGDLVPKTVEVFMTPELNGIEAIRSIVGQGDGRGRGVTVGVGS